jgi:hypothetical protein
VLIVVQPSWDALPISVVPAIGGAFFAVYAPLNRCLSSRHT